jgi:phosphoribosylformylglycinamidine cyclo-ligase
MGIDYKQAGVDIEQGDALVDWLKKSQPKAWPHQDKLVSGIGGFSALFRADFKGMQDPCLVSCTDGVGTKIKLASYFKTYASVGQDLVAMCVNDMLCVGAQPLFFLDYYATGKLDSAAAQEFLGGVQKACLESELALIGGETAEMPGVYQPGDFDCAGFCVGVVDRPKALGEHFVKAGDKLIAIASSGFHSNGYSLLRKVFEKDLDAHEKILMEPTALYVEIMQKVLKQDFGVHAAAHITGGGLDNILRVIPDGMAVNLNPWKVPASFLKVKKRAEIPWPSLLTTLNCGLGMVLSVEASRAEALIQFVNSQNGPRAFAVGEVIKAAEKKWTLNESALEAASAGQDLS